MVSTMRSSSLACLAPMKGSNGPKKNWKPRGFVCRIALLGWLNGADERGWIGPWNSELDPNIMLLCSCRCKADAWIYIFFRRMSVFHSRWLLIAGAVLNRWARAKQALRLRPTVWACWPVGRLLHASSHLISSNIHQSRSISVVQNPNGYLSPKHVGTWPNLPRLSSKSQSWLEHGQAAGQRKDVWHCEIVSGFRWWGLTLDTGLKEGEKPFQPLPRTSLKRFMAAWKSRQVSRKNATTPWLLADSGLCK